MLISKHIEDSLVKVSEVTGGKIKTGYQGNPSQMEYDLKPKVINIRGIKSSSNYYIEQLLYDNNAPLPLDVMPYYILGMKLMIDDLFIKNEKIYKSLKKHRTSSKIPLTNTEYYKEIEYYKV